MFREQLGDGKAHLELLQNIGENVQQNGAKDRGLSQKPVGKKPFLARRKIVNILCLATQLCRESELFIGL